MKTKALALAAVMLVSPLIVPAAHATVLRVVAVQTDDAAAYTKEIERGNALIKKLGGSATIRVWRAKYAGAEAGTVVVSLEYPDLATLAADEKKLQAAPEYQAWFQGLQKMRKIVSDSLYDELKS